LPTISICFRNNIFIIYVILIFRFKLSYYLTKNLCFSYIFSSSDFETPTEGDTDVENKDNVVIEQTVDTKALYTEIDTYLEGGETEKLKAYELLQNNKSKVIIAD